MPDRAPNFQEASTCAAESDGDTSHRPVSADLQHHTLPLLHAQRFVDADLIRRQVPDYAERLFYVSGSPTLVQGVRAALRELGVAGDRIKTDYFSGL